MAEGSGRPPQQFVIKLVSKKQGSDKSRGPIIADAILARIPMIRDDIPIAILFRALNICSDKEIQDMIIYDEKDIDMIEMLRVSLESGCEYRTQDDALDFIAGRGPQTQQSRSSRIRWASMVLEGDFLPHVSLTPEGLHKKAYFVGYMVNRLLTAHLGRCTEDDRDYYGKKRMELAGTLMSGLYRQLFRAFVEDMIKRIKKDLDSPRSRDYVVSLTAACRHNSITSGLRSALATGNWGKDKHGNV
jgi:DNA-directed RNA polymerase II subunit RPB2